MAKSKPKCVGLKCEVKDVFDKTLKKAVLGQILATVEQAVDKQKAKGLTFDIKCKDGWQLSVTVASLKADDPKNPKTLETKVLVKGIHLEGDYSAFNASGSAKATGINAKKVEQEATGLVDIVLADLMNKKIVPQLLK